MLIGDPPGAREACWLRAERRSLPEADLPSRTHTESQDLQAFRARFPSMIGSSIAFSGAAVSGRMTMILRLEFAS